MRVLSAALVLLAATPAHATETGWTTSSDYVNMGDVFGQRWLATEADESGKFRLSYACDQIHGEGYFVIETPLPRAPEEVTTTPVQVMVGSTPLDFNGHTQVHGNIYYETLTVGLYQYQQVETFAQLVDALNDGNGEVGVTFLDARAVFDAEGAAAGIGYVDENCR